jgi:hypothetical protein
MNEGPDFADDIVPDAVPKHTAPAKDDFKPWHKTRKQFIRIRQWNWLVARMVKRYLKSLQTEGEDWSVDFETTDEEDVPEEILVEKPLKCLVIPGDDLLDLRSLWHSLRPLKCYIKYLGFNESHGSSERGTRVHVAHNDVTSLHKVNTRSLILADRFQSVASLHSQAYRYVKEFGPFNMVNLDLCDTLFPGGSEKTSEYYNALHRLIEYQMKNQTMPWLLFITTQVEPKAVDAAGLAKLCGPTRQNYDNHTEFADRIKGWIPQDAFAPTDRAIDISKLSETHMVRLFGLALGKWLMSLAASASPKWILQMLRSYRYVIKQDTNVEMLSLAFLFRPKFVPPTDPTGISTLEIAVPKFPEEPDSAIKLITSVEGITDVDDLLQTDASLREEMEKSAADLIAAAGYDRDAYMEWIKGEN